MMIEDVSLQDSTKIEKVCILWHWLNGRLPSSSPTLTLSSDSQQQRQDTLDRKHPLSWDQGAEHYLPTEKMF